MSKVHELKSWPEFFAPVYDNVKRFELRLNDRKYKVGDNLHLQELDDFGKYTGRSCMRRIVYMLEGVGPGAIPPLCGLHRGYVILGIE
jgi:hypothetical protein